MMDLLKKNKLIDAGLILVVLALVYYFFFTGSSPAPTLQESTAQTASPVSQSLLVTLNNLHTIKLDSAVFNDPVFVSLTDFGVVIPQEAVGRRNPFAPLGSNGIPTSTPATKAH